MQDIGKMAKAEIEQKSQKLEENRIKLSEYKSEIEKLKQELQEKSEKVEEFRKKNEEQRTQISQLKETLEKSSLPLPKKQNTLKRKRDNTQQEEREGEKKIKFQQLLEREKTQELIAEIEVPTGHK